MDRRDTDNRISQTHLNGFIFLQAWKQRLGISVLLYDNNTTADHRNSEVDELYLPDRHPSTKEVLI